MQCRRVGVRKNISDCSPTLQKGVHLERPLKEQKIVKSVRDGTLLKTRKLRDAIPELILTQMPCIVIVLWPISSK